MHIWDTHVISTLPIYFLGTESVEQIRTGIEQSTSAKPSDSDKRTNQLHLQPNTYFWPAPGDFGQGRRTSGRTGRTSGGTRVEQGFRTVSS